MIILIDKREQNPVLYDKMNDPRFPDLKIMWGTLKTGDYSLYGYELAGYSHSVCIERKSLSDLFQSCGRGRARLQKEFERMAEFDHAEIIIENDLRTMFKNPPPMSMMKPKTVYRTLLAWSQRYNVKVWPCPSRSFMEQHIFLTLKRFYDDRQINGKQEFCKI